MRHVSEFIRADIYESVTNAVIAQIEAGAGEFRMPWHHDGQPVHRPMNARAQTWYRGINVFALWIAAEASHYPTGFWATYRQWRELDAQVRKGESGTSIVFWKKMDTKDRDADEEKRPRFFARGFTVFNAAQVDGFTPPALPNLPETERIAQAEQFYAVLGIETRFGGNQASYDPTRDIVQMPPFRNFLNAVAFYATLLHEGAHATAAPHRLSRTLSGRFGSEAYAMEEMIADWASCLACATLGLKTEPRDDHARYIADWLKVLRDDRRAVFTAAAKAQEVVDWMWAQQPGDLYAAPAASSAG